jgi:hypothetical protein
MSVCGRDKVTFLCTKRIAERCVIIVTCTTLHDGNQSCCAHDSSERERGGRGSHQWRHLTAGLRRWSGGSAQQRRAVVLQWGDSPGREEGKLEPEWVQWRMGVVSVSFIGS